MQILTINLDKTYVSEIEQEADIVVCEAKDMAEAQQLIAHGEFDIIIQSIGDAEPNVEFVNVLLGLTAISTKIILVGTRLCLSQSSAWIDLGIDYLAQPKKTELLDRIHTNML